MTSPNTQHYVLICVLLLGTAVLLCSPFLASLRIEIFSGLSQGLREPAVAVTNVAENTEITSLREQVALLSWRLLTVQENLESLTSFREKFALEKVPNVIPACILARRDSSLHRHSFLIDRGRKDGVTAGAAAVFGHSLVGRVKEAGEYVSRVLYVSDPLMRIGVILLSTTEGKETQYGEGICIGMGKYCELRFVEKNYQEWNAAYVLTSGLQGDYLPGLVIGKVQFPTNQPKGQESQENFPGEEIGLFWNLRVQPVDLDKIQTVLILKTTNS